MFSDVTIIWEEEKIILRYFSVNSQSLWKLTCENMFINFCNTFSSSSIIQIFILVNMGKILRKLWICACLLAISSSYSPALPLWLPLTLLSHYLFVYHYHIIFLKFFGWCISIKKVVNNVRDLECLASLFFPVQSFMKRVEHNYKTSLSFFSINVTINFHLF